MLCICPPLVKCSTVWRTPTDLFDNDWTHEEMDRLIDNCSDSLWFQSSANLPCYNLLSENSITNYPLHFTKQRAAVIILVFVTWGHIFFNLCFYFVRQLNKCEIWSWLTEHQSKAVLWISLVKETWWNRGLLSYIFTLTIIFQIHFIHKGFHNIGFWRRDYLGPNNLW